MSGPKDADDVEAALERARWRDRARRGDEDDPVSEEVVGRYLLQKMLADPGACRRCYGAGLVVKKRTGGVEPWLPWALLPPGQNLGVISANIQPMICRTCGGSGERPKE